MLSSKNTGKARPSADQVNRGSLFAYLRSKYFPLQGRTDGSTAPAGNVGEYTAGGTSGVALTSTVAITIQPLTLSPGDWDVFANLEVAPAAGTSITSIFAVISNTNNALNPAEPGSGFTLLTVSFPVGQNQFVPICPCRVNVTVTTIVYLVTLVVFSGGTCAAGGIIKARRMS